MTDMNLENQRVVIVGGSSGIGLATARLAAAQGAAVTIVGSRRVDAALEQLPAGAEGYIVDVRDEQAVASLFGTLGRFHHLVYTAGEALTLSPIADLDLDRARHALDIRIWGVYATVKHAHPHIRKGGSITLSSGSAGQRPQPTWSVSASICGATEALTRTLALELAPIRVNAVAPGVVRTTLWSDMSEPEQEALYAGVGGSLPIGRVGEAEEVAETYIHLMRNEYTSGTIVAVDGGALLV
jgi:NAD(P)-dependent dehydrogenase (short-subunit alcohol dehydrogenase family)